MNKAKRFLVLALTVILCSGQIIAPAMAESPEAPATEPAVVEVQAEEPKAETKTESKQDEATGTDLTITTTTTTDDNGKGTVTVTIEKEWTSEESTESEKSEESTESEETTESTESTETEETTEPEESEESEDESGIVINGEETTVITDTPTETTEEVDGSETREWTEEDAGDEEGQPEVEVELIPGETTTGTAESTETTGDVPTDENDENYDYTETTTTEREVTAETSDMEVTVNDPSTGEVGEQETELKGLAPTYDEDDNEIRGSNGKIKDTEGKDGLFDRNYLSSQSMKKVTLENGITVWVNGDNRLTSVTIPEGAELPEDFTYEIGDNILDWYNAQPKASKKTGIAINNIDNWYDSEGNLIHAPVEGAEFAYVGTGEHSKYFAGFVRVTYEEDENGNLVMKLKDSGGNDILLGGEAADEILPGDLYDGYSGSRAQNFMLMDKNGNRVYAYCCDLDTGASGGYWYSVSNLEDSNYYASEESEEHIRSIATNGYWGTSDVPNTDGTYNTGSLESIKAKLKAAIENGEIDRYVKVPVRDTSTAGGGKVQKDENGNPIYYDELLDILTVLDGLTEGEAMLATQAAIWSYANGNPNALNGEEGDIIVSPDWYRNHQVGYSKNEGEHLDDNAGARVTLLYNWLINLETEETSTVIINEKNNVEDVSLTVKDKVKDHAQNQDDDKDNDVYNTDLNFKLAFIPGENDDLLVQISYTDLDGNRVNVIRRLAGENAEGQNYMSIFPEADGSYVLRDLKLSENEDFNFDLRLEGTQYLENGVYIYQPVGGRDSSQTFVGVAEGERNVDVTVGMTISFDVDEDDKVVAERKWHSKKVTPKPTRNDPPRDPADPGDPRDPGDPTPTTRTTTEYPVVTVDGDAYVAIGEELVPLAEAVEDGLIEILDDEIPLAAVPQTGDGSGMMAMMSLMSLAGIVFLSKKKEVSAN